MVWISRGFGRDRSRLSQRLSPAAGHRRRPGPTGLRQASPRGPRPCRAPVAATSTIGPSTRRCSTAPSVIRAAGLPVRRQGHEERDRWDARSASGRWDSCWKPWIRRRTPARNAGSRGRWRRVAANPGTRISGGSTTGGSTHGRLDSTMSVMTNPCRLAARSATEATAVTLRATSTLGAAPNEHGVSAASGAGPTTGGGDGGCDDRALRAGVPLPPC